MTSHNTGRVTTLVESQHGPVRTCAPVQALHSCSGFLGPVCSTCAQLCTACSVDYDEMDDSGPLPWESPPVPTLVARDETGGHEGREQAGVGGQEGVLSCGRCIYRRASY